MHQHYHHQQVYIMNDHDMEEDFDFGGLTLGEFPRDQTTQSSDVLHLTDSLSTATLLDKNSTSQDQAGTHSQIGSTTIATDSTPNPTSSIASPTSLASSTSTLGPTPDNGPWAKLPSESGEINPFLPGVTAQKLDAMAMDPYHVFKSAPPNSGYSIPQPATTSSSQKQQEQDQDENVQRQDVSSEDKIPNWMLEDPELKPTTHLDWTTTTSFSPTHENDDWGSPGSFAGIGGFADNSNLSTTVDSNALFGFSSFPTYESLPIANAIAEEEYRKHTLLAASEGGYDPFSSYSTNNETSEASRTQEGGFARYGNMSRGDREHVLTFGQNISSLDSGSTVNQDHDFVWDSKDHRTGLTGSQPHSQWQIWRPNNVPSSGATIQVLDDLDEDLTEDIFNEGSPKIK
ncbi:hypothetical protein FBU30_010041 [Linnemannia zychae]|nr:hypothetical protein FBU30_010041 [Linnemannia zychae]